MTHVAKTGPELEDPELERQRAEQAAEHERESRASEQTKYDQAQELADREAEERAERVADVPGPVDED